MKIGLACIVAVLPCSCHWAPDHSDARDFGIKTPRQEEVLQIMRDDCLSEMMHADSVPREERKALQRIRDDPYANLPRYGFWMAVDIPEMTWEVRGPLTMPEAREEYIDFNAMYPRTPAEEKEFREKFEETGPGRSWARFEGQYRDGDEVYYYCPDRRGRDEGRGNCGYVLIRGRSVVEKRILWSP